MRRARLLIAALLLALPVASIVEAKPRGRAKTARTKSVRKKPAPVKVREEPKTESTPAPLPSRGPARIDFDDRLVQGQTNTSGAVYLYERKELRAKSMLKLPESFRAETLQSVFGE